jgi:hypothetical protein
MKVLNIHELELKAPPERVGAQVDSLASPRDALRPRRTWPAMAFDRTLDVGAKGGHRPIRYIVEAYEPGRSVKFRFIAPKGFDGFHKYEVRRPAGRSVVLRHTLKMTTRGCASKGSVHLAAPRLRERPESLQGILAHELSHLHLQQHLGRVAWSLVPAGFHEGLAVSAPGGGGAEKLLPQQARDAIVQGRAFCPDGSQNPLFPRTAHAYGLEPQMFYRQSEPPVSQMRRGSPARFRVLMEGLYAGGAARLSVRGRLRAVARTVLGCLRPGHRGRPPRPGRRSGEPASAEGDQASSRYPGWRLPGAVQASTFYVGTPVAG